MAIQSPIYSPAQNLVSYPNNIKALPNGQFVGLGPIDVQAIRCSDVVLSIQLNTGPAVSVATGYIGVYALPLIDSTWLPVWMSSVNLSLNSRLTWPTTDLSGMREIAVIPALANNTQINWTDTLCQYLGTLSPFEVILIYNNTGDAFNADAVPRVYYGTVGYEYA